VRYLGSSNDYREAFGVYHLVHRGGNLSFAVPEKFLHEAVDIG
jgi:hypothetical protein